MTSSCIDQCLCDRHWILNLWSGSIEISKVYGDAPSAILFLYRYDISNPLSVRAWPDKPGVQHFLDLFRDFFQNFGLHLSCSLLERPKSFLQRERCSMMLLSNPGISV